MLNCQSKLNKDIFLSLINSLLFVDVKNRQSYWRFIGVLNGRAFAITNIVATPNNPAINNNSLMITDLRRCFFRHLKYILNW